MPKIIRDNYVTHLVIDKKEIESIRFIYGSKKKLSQWKKDLSCDAIINGALFNMNNGVPIETFIYDGKYISKSSWCNVGMSVLNNGSLKYGNVVDTDKDFMVGFPTLVTNSTVNINFDIGSSLSSANPRSVLSYNDGEILLTTVDGRQTNKPGMTIKRLSEYMQMMGVTHAINMDGGGSTRMYLGDELLNSPTEDRAVSVVVAVWFKKENVKTPIENGGDDMKTICLDYGHNDSGWDTGASYYGYKEQDFNFDIGKLVKAGLERHGIKIIETRPTKTTILGTDLNSSLSKRANIANSSNADYFVSIHCNANTNASAYGSEIYIQGTGGNAEKMANSVLPELCASAGTYNRGVKVQNLAVTRLTNMPAILIELAFMSNKSESDKLAGSKKLFSDGIIKGICKFLGINYIPESNVPYPTPAPENQPNKYSYDDTVEALIVDGIVSGNDNMVYWEKAFAGVEPMYTEYVRTLLKRYSDKLRQNS